MTGLDNVSAKEILMDIHPDMTAWRRDLHAHPELAFEEYRTSAFVQDQLRSWGIEVHGGLAKTGVVGVLRAGEDSRKAIGLRADMDALPIHEANEFPHRSQIAGKMHACGHDGHVTTLLGAARYLSFTKNFEGAVYFVFQPAEESFGGGKAMVEEGLFSRFPTNSIYALHNWPGVASGHFAIRSGPVMASMDTFAIRLSGHSTHAAMPHLGRDPIVAGGHLVLALQTVASRIVAPAEPVAITVTQIHAGDTWNVIPEILVLRGTARALDESTQEQIERSLRCIVDGISAAHDVMAQFEYRRHYPITINDEAATNLAADVARAIVGNDRVHTSLAPSMGAEDFAFMLQQKPGCYAWIGNGSIDNERILHNPRYDFNDEILPIGATFFADLAERELSSRR